MSEMKNIGGLWIKASKKSGKKFLSGLDIRMIQELDPDKWQILIFKNEKKSEEKQPDYNVVALEQQQKYQKKTPYSKPQPPPRDDEMDF